MSFEEGEKKIINEKYIKEEARKTVPLVDVASVPIHPYHRFF